MEWVNHFLNHCHQRSQRFATLFQIIIEKSHVLLSNNLIETWHCFTAQSILTQLSVSLVFIVLFIVIFTWIYMRFTKIKCGSKAKLDGKTALITGANSGKERKLERIKEALNLWFVE